MDFSRPHKRSAQRRLTLGFVAAVAAICSSAVLAVPAFGHQIAPRSAGLRHTTAGATSNGQAGSSDLTDLPTLQVQNGGSGMANLPVTPAKLSCADLAQTTQVNGQTIQITEQQTTSASPGSPVYCAVAGHINTNIGFEILLPTSTWRQRYLQVGCGGLCGSIGINPPQTTGYAPLADGDFVLAAEDDGHSGNSTSWYNDPLQRVQFAYLSYHDVALVAKGLAEKFYGMTPRYSYFDGCSQGGHEALGEVQRYPTDFNGVLAGAPASIMTELNSILHEYTYAANYADGNYSAPGPGDSPILDQAQANIVLNAAMKACYPTVGLMLDYRSCAQKFNVDSVKCPATLTSNCLTPAQIAVVQKVWNGPVDAQGQHLYPGGYSLGSEFNWSNGTSANLPLTPGATVTPASFITSWLQYFAFGTPEVGNNVPTAVADETFTKAYFEQIEKLAPYWDATDPDLRPFERAGGKLILWQGEADWSIPTITSIAYYQAVIKAMGGLQATRQFAKYYLLPSVGHCGGNGPDTYNGLGAVVAWTERHISPQSLVATQYAPATGGGPGGPPPGGGSTSDLTDAVPTLGAPAATAAVRTINLFPYPKLPAYNGYGNVDDASSYVGKVSSALQQPTPWLGKFDTRMIWCNTQGLDCKQTSGGGFGWPWPSPPDASSHRRT